ncbi:hypothetical protein GW17_00035489 [Ensete ventricosum]|uniref:Uncharacterized protein n=1 Tax=Ensete ventricosum TaxID=4639 RepID=A0A427A997_ENSVE|nr:hypothetical protein B296_00034129 [Ensete ventricosum]RWW01473.1 hypothetical protein GW17_00035489 [Ensete ventricosum]
MKQLLKQRNALCLIHLNSLTMCMSKVMVLRYMIFLNLCFIFIKSIFLNFRLSLMKRVDNAY